MMYSHVSCGSDLHHITVSFIQDLSFPQQDLQTQQMHLQYFMERDLFGVRVFFCFLCKVQSITS